MNDKDPRIDDDWFGKIKAISQVNVPHGMPKDKHDKMSDEELSIYRELDVLTVRRLGTDDTHDTPRDGRSPQEVSKAPKPGRMKAG
jgi:hypothetical protein